MNCRVRLRTFRVTSPMRSASGPYELDMDPFFNDFFSGGGEVTAIVGPFTEFLLNNAAQYDPKSGTGEAVVGFNALAQSGTVTLSYTYSVVPEPMSAAVMSAFLLGRRRR